MVKDGEDKHGLQTTNLKNLGVSYRYLTPNFDWVTGSSMFLVISLSDGHNSLDRKPL